MTNLIVSINRQVVDGNRKRGETKPPVRVSRGRYGKPVYGHAATITGLSRLIYLPDHPLPCGARLWLETGDPVDVFDTTTQKETRVWP